MNTNNFEARPRRSKRLPLAITGLALVLALGAGKEVINNREEADRLTEAAAGGSREAAVMTVDATSAYIARLALAAENGDRPDNSRKQQATGRMVITTVCNPDDPKSYSFNTLDMRYDLKTTKTAEGTYVNAFDGKGIKSITVSRLANENNQSDQVIALNPDKQHLANYQAAEIYATVGNEVYSSEKARLYRLGPNQTGHLLNEDNDQPVLEYAIAVVEMIVEGDCSVRIPEPPVVN